MSVLNSDGQAASSCSLPFSVRLSSLFIQDSFCWFMASWEPLSLSLSLLNLAASHKDSHHGGEEARWLGHRLAMPQPAKSSSWIHKLYIYYRICIRYSVNEICILCYFVFLVWTGDIYCMSVYPGRGIFPLCTLNKLTEQAECSLELQMLYII